MAEIAREAGVAPAELDAEITSLLLAREGSTVPILLRGLPLLLRQHRLGVGSRTLDALLTLMVDPGETELDFRETDWLSLAIDAVGCYEFEKIAAAFEALGRPESLLDPLAAVFPEDRLEQLQAGSVSSGPGRRAGESQLELRGLALVLPDRLTMRLLDQVSKSLPVKWSLAQAVPQELKTLSSARPVPDIAVIHFAAGAGLNGDFADILSSFAVAHPESALCVVLRERVLAGDVRTSLEHYPAMRDTTDLLNPLLEAGVQEVLGHSEYCPRLDRRRLEALVQRVLAKKFALLHGGALG
ncbi:MAG: hypothetical protein HY303_09510 [Candidatus Wallbacteria bacterium]|nr:hypothetical protein [Candidatus Wallbacteria bacterium]